LPLAGELTIPTKGVVAGTVADYLHFRPAMLSVSYRVRRVPLRSRRSFRPSGQCSRKAREVFDG
jgi:hypothetical protein